MSLAFLSPASGTALARSPIERCTAQDGARFAARDGWNVAVSYGADVAAERRAAERSAGWADVSQLAKLELQGDAADLAAIAGFSAELGAAARHEQAWWAPLTPTRWLVVAASGARGALLKRLDAAAADTPGRVSVTDVSCRFAALTVVGPLATEVMARFSALDLRSEVTPVGGLRPGSIARQPAVLIREAEQRYLFLCGAATGEYVWSVVADAGHHLGGRAIGADALSAWEVAGA